MALGSKIKKDFPLLQRQKSLVYLDSAATSQKPRAVIGAIQNWYERSNANVHRGAYRLAETATAEFEQGRNVIANFIGSPDPQSIVFTKSATEAINLVATAWAEKNLQAGAVILLTEMEHHANIVPWQLLAKKKKLKLRYWPINNRGRLIKPTPKLWSGVKLLGLSHVSNVLGTINPVAQITAIAKKKGIAVLIDAAQSVPHLPISRRQTQPDFLVFSGHKMLGPTGIGVVYINPERYAEMQPYQGGGEMIEQVNWHGSTFKPGPWQFEAGTQPLAQVAGLVAAIGYLEKIGLAKIKRHNQQLIAYAYKKLKAIPEITIYGPGPTERIGVISFNIADIHPHDLASWLDRFNIAIRAGHHCAQPLHQKLGVVASARASFYLYNSKKDVDRLIQGLHKIIKLWPNSTTK